MRELTQMTQAVTHQVYAALLVLARRDPASEIDPASQRDRGAVSLEQVLWFAAAGLSVAVVAGFLWNQIRATANDPINRAPAPPP